jgi:L-2-hydroxyglutarate oxidase LhgO
VGGLALVIGAGVVGLAAARALALAGHEVVVAEASGLIGSGISSRNSEVVHGGMYYPAGSLKALHCVAGRRLLHAYADSRGIPHRKCGKLIVATDDRETDKIAVIHRSGLANGVEGLELLDARQAMRLEPNLACTAALFSPETGIVDSHAFMLSLVGEIEDRGGAIALHTPVQAVSRMAGGWRARFGGTESSEIEADIVVNAAGLGSWAVAAAIDAYPAARVPRRVLAKGNYFACAGRPAFSRLIYPAPVDGGLGVHLTLDMAGRMKFGPDVEWLDGTEHYTVDPARADGFYAAIRRYWPGLPDGALVADYAGIRPKITGSGEPAGDFVIDGPAEHGLPGLVCLFGIESPGLTSSLSLGEAVAAALA